MPLTEISSLSLHNKENAEVKAVENGKSSIKDNDTTVSKLDRVKALDAEEPLLKVE